MTVTEVRTFVIGHQVLEVELERGDRADSLGLSVRLDGAMRWSSEEPGWRDIGCGVDDGDAFLWSARRLVVVPLKGGAHAYAVQSDEDIGTVFRTEEGWLLVCETSLHLVIDDTDRSRLDLPDVVIEARWENGNLVIRCDDGSRVSVTVAEGELASKPEIR